MSTVASCQCNSNQTNVSDVEDTTTPNKSKRVREAQTDRWRKAASAYLKLLPRDSAFTLDLFRAQRQLLFDLDLNAQ